MHPKTVRKAISRTCEKMLDTSSTIVLCFSVFGVIFIVVIATLYFLSNRAKIPTDRDRVQMSIIVDSGIEQRPISVQDLRPSAPPPYPSSRPAAPIPPYPSLPNLAPPNLFARSLDGGDDDAPIIYSSGALSNAGAYSRTGSASLAGSASIAGAASLPLSRYPARPAPAFLAAPAIFSSDPALWDTSRHNGLLFTASGGPAARGPAVGPSRLEASGRSYVSSLYDEQAPAPAPPGPPRRSHMPRSRRRIAGTALPGPRGRARASVSVGAPLGGHGCVTRVVPHQAHAVITWRRRRRQGCCLLCLDAPRTVALEPCRHACLCRPCYDAVVTADRACPVCR